MFESPNDLFQASLVKIERANQHIAELERVAAEFLASGPVTCEFVSNQVFEGRFRGFSFKMDFKAVPPVMSAIIGDVIHNLRTALDLLACETCRRRNQPEDDVYFPFAEDERSLHAIIKRRHMDRAGADVVKLVLELKPYKNGNAALRTIHDLDIRDKHRALLPALLQAGGPFIEAMDEQGNYYRDENGNPAPKLHGDPNKPSSVALGFPPDNALANGELIPTLHHLVEMTARVVKAFELLLAPTRQPPVSGGDTSVTLDAALVNRD